MYPNIFSRFSILLSLCNYFTFSFYLFHLFHFFKKIYSNFVNAEVMMKPNYFNKLINDLKAENPPQPKKNPSSCDYHCQGVVHAWNKRGFDGRKWPKVQDRYTMALHAMEQWSRLDTAHKLTVFTREPFALPVFQLIIESVSFYANLKGIDNKIMPQHADGLPPILEVDEAEEYEHPCNTLTYHTVISADQPSAAPPKHNCLPAKTETGTPIQYNFPQLYMGPPKLQ
jgi:hypothetical protein